MADPETPCKTGLSGTSVDRTRQLPSTVPQNQRVRSLSVSSENKRNTPSVSGNACRRNVSKTPQAAVVAAGGASASRRPVFDGTAGTSGLDVETETRCLYHWLRLLEKHLQSASLHRSLEDDRTAIAEELRNHMTVQSTIEKLVYRLGKLKNLSENEPEDSDASSQPSKKRLRERQLNLEKRLHQCWLKSLERQFILEELLEGTSHQDHLGKRDLDTGSSSESLYEPLQKCRRLSFEAVPFLIGLSPTSEADIVQNAPEPFVMALAQPLAGKPELASQDIGYASESSTFNLSMDDVSPSLPVAPPFAPLSSNHHYTMAHSDTDTSKKSDSKRPKVWLETKVNGGKSSSSLRASPNEFYYKVAPLTLDIRGETLSRSARSSLSRLRAGTALAFTDDEEESKAFRSSVEEMGSSFRPAVADSPGVAGGNPFPHSSPFNLPASLPPLNHSTKIKRRENCVRASTLPPEFNRIKTNLLTSQCTATPTRKPRRPRPWSLILQEAQYQPLVEEPTMAAAVSESSLESSKASIQRLKKKVLSVSSTGINRKAPRKIHVDWSGSSSEDEDGEASLSDGSSSVLMGSRRTLTCGFPNKVFTGLYGEECRRKSLSTSALSRKNGRVTGQADMDAIYWDDYQDPLYASEVYSEKSVDDSIVQRILNFGDDYSDIFPSGTPSAYASFIGSRSVFSLPLEENCLMTDYEKPPFSEISGNEEDRDLLRVLSQSRIQLGLAQSEAGKPNRPDQLEDIRATCQTNIAWLSTISQHMEKADNVVGGELLDGSDKENNGLESSVGLKQKTLLAELMEQWGALHQEISGKETCAGVMRQLVQLQREIQLQLHSAGLSFFSSPVLIHNLTVCSKLKTNLQSKLNNLHTLHLRTTELTESAKSHISTCPVKQVHQTCTLQSVSDLTSHLQKTVEKAEFVVSETEEYYLLLQSLTSKLAFLQASFSHSLPDLVPLSHLQPSPSPSHKPQMKTKALPSLEKLPEIIAEKLSREPDWCRNMETEWVSTRSVMERLQGMKRFLLMDQDLIRRYQETEEMLTVCLTGCSQRSSPERGSMGTAVKLQMENQSGSENDDVATTEFSTKKTLLISTKKLVRCSVAAEDKDKANFSSLKRWFCLWVAPVGAFLIFLCLLAGFLLEPICCTFKSQRSLWTLSLDYPTGSPPL